MKRQGMKYVSQSYLVLSSTIKKKEKEINLAPNSFVSIDQKLIKKCMEVYFSFFFQKHLTIEFNFVVL